MEEARIWQILQIEPTKDEEEIRTAYRAKLVQTNPEDDPEGFKALREAFEKAVFLCHNDETQPEEGELTPVQELVKRADEIYSDYERRRNVEEWQEWISDPLIEALDTVDEVRKEFLVYMLDHFSFPTDVWRLFDEVFRIRDEQAALSEVFPENFIRYIVSHIEEEDYFEYDELIPRENIPFAGITDIEVTAEEKYVDDSEISELDKYIKNASSLYNIYAALNNRYTPEENKEGIMKEFASRIVSLRQGPVYHPTEMAGLIRFLDYSDRNDEALPICEFFLTDEYIEKYDDYTLVNLAYVLINTYKKQEREDLSGLEQAKKVVDMVIEKEPKYVLANYARSIYYFLHGDYVKADEDVLVAAEFNDQNMVIDDFVTVVDNKLIEYYEGILENEPDNVKTAIELGWCYLRKDDSDKAIEMLKKITPDEENGYGYYNLYGRCYIKDEKYAEAYPYIEKWQGYLLELYEKSKTVSPEELSDDEKKRLERVAYSFYLVALCKKDTGDIDGAMSSMDTAIEYSDRYDEKVRYTHIKGQMMNELEMYEEAVDHWTKMIEDIPDYMPAYVFRQEAAFELRDGQMVINDFWRIIDFAPDYKKAYVLAAKVYNIYNRPDLFDEMMEAAENNQIASMALDFELAKRFTYDRDYQKANEIFEDLVPHLYEEECDIENKSEFFTEYGIVLYNLAKNTEDEKESEGLFREAMALAEKAIEENNKSRRAHWLKTDCLESLKENADEEYTNMLSIFSEDPDVFYEYGLYMERQNRNEDAISLFMKTINMYDGHRSAHGKISDYYLDVYYNSEDIKDYNNAVDHARKQLNNYASAYYYIALALVYIEGNEFEKAIDAAKKAIQEEDDNIYAYNALAYPLMMLRRNEEAQDAFDKGLQLSEERHTRTALQKNYLKFLEMNARYAEAIEFSKKYYADFGLESVDTHRDLAALYKKNKQREEALLEYKAINSIYVGRMLGQKADREYIGIFDARSHIKETDIETLSYMAANQIRIMELYVVMGRIEDYRKVYDDFVKFVVKENFNAKYRFVDPDENVKRHAGFVANILREIGRHEMFVRRNYAEAIKCMELVVKFKELEDPQSNYKMHMFGKSMLELAEAYMRAGRAKEAAEMAQRCLPALIYPNKTIEEYLSYPNERPYRYGEIAKYYFYTGEASKAPGCLSQMTEYPACNFCRNKACYDRVLTDANFYEIVGKYDLALGCYNTARQMCDDDTEIDAAIAALNGQQYI